MPAMISWARRPVVWCVVLSAILSAISPSANVRASSALLVDLPKVTAQAVYSFDVTAGVELIADNADERRAPASTTKIAAAIVVVDHLTDLNQEVTVEDTDIAPLADDESKMGLGAGDILTVRDLLDGMLVQSGSDATYAAARVTGNAIDPQGDPVAVFIEAMNGLVADLGLENTHFTNPVGIDESDHYSSARDLALLAKAALDRPVIAEIVAQATLQKQIGGPNPREVTLTNTNQLLDGDRIDGVKTGSTGDAGGCLVLSSWQRGTNRVITVVLGSELTYVDGLIDVDKRWDDTEAILSSINTSLHWAVPSSKNDFPGLSDELAAWQVTLHDKAAIVVPADQSDSLGYLLQLGPVAKPNEQVGNVLFFVGSEKIAERPVFQKSAP